MFIMRKIRYFKEDEVYGILPESPSEPLGLSAKARACVCTRIHTHMLTHNALGLCLYWEGEIFPSPWTQGILGRSNSNWEKKEMAFISYIKPKCSFICSLTSIGHLWCARHGLRHWGYRAEQNDRVLVIHSRGQDRSPTNTNPANCVPYLIREDPCALLLLADKNGLGNFEK